MSKRSSFANGWLQSSVWLFAGLTMLAGAAHAQQDSTARALNLPTSKQLMMPVPGDPARPNSLPAPLAVAPDRDWVRALNAAHRPFASAYLQPLPALPPRPRAAHTL